MKSGLGWQLGLFVFVIQSVAKNLVVLGLGLRPKMVPAGAWPRSHALTALDDNSFGLWMTILLALGDNAWRDLWDWMVKLGF